jgi:hypothetical protein|tara:strand:+ start:109 stop:450 length:342 start_codon:yes stop_codon:yes gene_type:complete
MDIYRQATLDGIRDLCGMEPLSEYEQQRLSDDRLEEERFASYYAPAWVAGSHWTPRKYAARCHNIMTSRESQGSFADVTYHVGLCNLHDGLDLSPYQCESVALFILELIEKGV